MKWESMYTKEWRSVERRGELNEGGKEIGQNEISLDNSRPPMG